MKAKVRKKERVKESKLKKKQKSEIKEQKSKSQEKDKTGYPEHDAYAGGPLAESASPTDLRTEGRTYGLMDGRIHTLIEMRRRI